jgi:hypothetical protein
MIAQRITREPSMFSAANENEPTRPPARPPNLNELTALAVPHCGRSVAEAAEIGGVAIDRLMGLWRGRTR